MMDDVHGRPLGEAQRKPTLSDGQDAGEMLLDIEAKIGELAYKEPQISTGRPKRSCLGGSDKKAKNQKKPERLG